MTKRLSSRNGSALLIILAFVLLLTIITTAFLSKALLEKTVSNASADQTRTDVFASGAVDAILSDCQQEIAAGSTITPATSTSPAIYTPASAQTVVPSRTWQSAAITQPNPLPNLLKRSACGLTFYPTGAMSGAGNYPNATAYPVSEKTFAAADSNDSTAAPSLNGRLYSAIRWNKALLLPKKDLTTSNNTDFTPNANFTVPDWILVQRDGSNPTVWSNTLCTASANDVTIANKNPVVGRYAYTIYDEGGLLDMNVTGYPSAGGQSNMPQHFYRTSLATVDLMQLLSPVYGTAFFPNVSATPTTKPSNPIIDAIVGWRNNATLQASGTSPSYAFTASYATNYFANVLPPGTGFLHTTVQPAVTSVTAGQSDRKFSSRQQLIDLLLNQIAPSLSGYTQTVPVTQANMQNALQYLGTFSRDLSQPSYQPDPNRPRMKASSTTVTTTAVTDVAFTGANAAATDDASSNTTTDGLPNGLINVSFPTTLVQTAFTRNDGSLANVGDPLVKKRFALNRLAWLTYAGPIATDAGTYNTATGISNLVTALKSQYGYTDAFLLQGGPTNVKNYFGLQWQQDPQDENATQRSKWFYNVHNNSAGSAGKGIIRELGGANGIAAASDTSPHDPDFFELLKAAILTGSKGKSFTDLSGAQYYQSGKSSVVDMTHPYNAQNNTDISFDYQILQIGANIIDQSRLDAYTTEIIFDNGVNGPFEVRGVENYPYLYRLRAGSLKLRNEHINVADDADKTTKPDNRVTYPNTATKFNDPGLEALVQIPEIWNPHDINSPLGIALGSATLPTSFRIIADSTTPTALATQITAPPFYASISVHGEDGQANKPAALNNSESTSALSTILPAYNLGPPSNPVGLVSGGYAGEGLQLTAANTALTFTVPTTASILYREPTMLSRPLLPAGSSLATAWTSPPADWTTARNTAGTVCYTAGKGFISDIANPLSLAVPPANESTSPTTQSYLGIVLGFFPPQFIVPLTPAAPTAATNYIFFSQFAVFASSPANTGITYRMQYQDPVQGGWVTYDEKYVTPRAGWVITPASGSTSGNLMPSGSVSFGQSSAWQTFADPRTSRFGATGGDNDTYTYDAAPGTFPYKNSPDYLDPNNGVLVSDRPDYSQGFMWEISRAAATFSLVSALTPGWVTQIYNTDANFRWGPISQNTMSATAQATSRYSGDTAASYGPYQATYYSDADGVVRRAMGGEVPNSSSTPANLNGYPMAVATVAGTPYNAPGTASGHPSSTQSESRPYLLKHPFRSVAELGYVFSGTPWKNLDFSNPESGDSALLDVFCVNDTDDPNALVAGRVNLNTQQAPVLAAILAEAYYDDANPNNGTTKGGYINALQWARIG